MQGSVLTVEECAQELKVSNADIMHLIGCGELNAKKVGSQFRIPLHSFYCFLEQPVPEHQELQSIKQTLQTIIEQTTPPQIHKKRMFEVIDEVLQSKKSSVTSNTLEWNRGISQHILKAFGDRYVDEITSKEIQEFYNTVSLNENGDKVSQRLMIGIENLLALCIRYSLENKYIAESPLTLSIRSPKCVVPDPHDRFMNYDSLCALLDVLENSTIYLTIVKLMVMTGLRIGEALALNWDDIDTVHSTIHVRRALIRDYYEDEKGNKKTRYIIGSTKTPESVRDIPVLPEVIHLLKSWKDYVHSQKKWMAAIEKNQTNHLVFSNKNGRLQNIHTFRANFRGCVERNGGEYLQATFHRLRHSYGSFLLEQGEQLITVSRLLGHKNIRVTADIYCAVTQKLKLQAADKTRNIWLGLKQIDYSVA